MEGITKMSDNVVDLSQTRLIAVSTQFANQGIAELIGAISRDPLMGSNIKLVVTEQKVSEILGESLKFPPYYLSDLVVQNMNNGNLPITNLHTLLYQYYGEGQDLYLPIVKKGAAGILQVGGIGIFKDDKLVSVLSGDEGFLLNLLTDKTFSGRYEFKTNPDEKLFVKILHGNRDRTKILPGDRVEIALKLHLLIKDYPTRLNLNDKQDALDLSRRIERHFNETITERLEKFQTQGTDPIGLGDIYRSKRRDWNERRFYGDTYPRVKFEVKTKIVISQSGVGV